MKKSILFMSNHPERSRFLKDNKNNLLLGGISAASYNGLVYGAEALEIYTPYEELDNIVLRGFVLRHYHLTDTNFIEEIEPGVYKPNREKCIIDTIVFLDKNYNEGLLIEMLQNYAYQEKRDFTKLYKVGEFYNVSKKTIDYWIKEADEEGDMSMG